MKHLLTSTIIAVLIASLVAFSFAVSYQSKVIYDQQLRMAQLVEEISLITAQNSNWVTTTGNLLEKQSDLIDRQNELLESAVWKIRERDIKIAELKKIIEMQADGSFRLFIEPIEEETQ